ncbi:glycoside hydrolase family 38 C-terminal domain-containing protein [Paenibacillus nasutitermitis]|uniref:Glycoside hydrolase family 38 central domain-containing protein n=1 Tax=Paenibacillus nasutitermitis TaxID=1652958 RepID=A0A916Z9G4_9BACL|nr:alpha-mannosidase [Paenibacillus nasutitermitis]GGD83026.1 hypothetical protein GCM10010911_46530 [Paenibacillus nasutitermitis]
MKKLHLLSNAHLDPVWQWEWEEGAAAAISTFRAAADFCEEYEGYVFNHNEVILYKWVEEYEPVLFERIQKLVALGKWHIMGGWYLQPDCNMPSGESFVRQIELGRRYFLDKFGVRPTTAINFDSFGHSRGLVQIMRLAGFDSYIFMRPDIMETLPAHDFIWEGYNGSRIMVHKVQGGYNSQLGNAHEKIAQWLEQNPEEPTGLILWGVGNHGGGASRLDLDRIARLKEQTETFELVHSTPEQYFRDLPGLKELPSFAGDLVSCNVGCYTSMIRIKQQHRKLENELYMTEKMLSAAAIQGLLHYPAADLHEAACDLMTAQFHDILPGSSVQQVEETSLRLLDHGLEITARLKARAFFALAAGQPKAELQEYPVLVYNPHPFPVTGLFECEFMLEDQNWKEEFSQPIVYRDGIRLPGQAEKEASNLNLDWRKKVVFRAELAPSSMNRFDCRIERLDSKPKPQLVESDGRFTFRTGELEVVINAGTGLLDEYKVNGVSCLAPGAFHPLVLQDNEDPWRMDRYDFGPVIGGFKLMDRGRGSDFSGLTQALLPSVRVVEDGEVRTIIEAVLQYNESSLCITYKLPKQGTQIEVHVRVFWNEKNKMLKLSIPTGIKDGRYIGQSAFGAGELAADGTETVAQKWVAVVSREHNRTVTCVNDGIYGSDFRDGEIRLSLLRGAGYCAHPIPGRTILPQDRFLPRIDQGERLYTFWLNASETEDRLARVDREAGVHNEKPYALSFFPSGDGSLPASAVGLSDEVVQLSAFKQETDGAFTVRLFEPTGTARVTRLSLPVLGIELDVHVNGFEIKTFRVDPQAGTIDECSMIAEQ